MSALEMIAKRVEEKPIPSQVAFELLKIIDDEDHSMRQVIQLVENDASLTTEVLKVANTATYRRGEPISTINRAVMLLGEMMVVGVSICASSSIVFHSALEGYDSERGEMWDHSLRSAIAARELSKYAKRKISPGLAFTAGLLHDIGKSVLSEFLVGSSEKLTQQCESGEVADYLEAERTLVGTDHAQIGYALAKQWSLPDVLAAAIRDHHVPAKADENHRALVYTVHLSDLVSMLGGAGTGSDALAYSMDDNYQDYISISRDELPLLLLNVQEEFLKIKKFFTQPAKVA